MTAAGWAAAAAAVLAAIAIWLARAWSRLREDERRLVAETEEYLRAEAVRP